jgi:hypothetical protein
MAKCSHGSNAPDAIVKTWPECQAGAGRHKCAVCAYAQGILFAQGKAFPGPVELCDKGHDSAPLAMLKALPSSQAGLERHRCSYRAFRDGLKAGALLNPQDEMNAAADDAEQAKIEARTDINLTQKKQLILARRGQGIFRNSVSMISTKCRVTGISDKRFLVASHIKPWRLSSDVERLDGYNGLLLAPHADKLFDGGWLTFTLDGSLKRSVHLPAGVWDAWGLSAYSDKNPFAPEYAKYLQYHQKEVFKS